MFFLRTPSKNYTIMMFFTLTATGVFEPQEEIGVKWPRDEPSSDNDSCYSTPSESPRDNSLGN